MINPLDYVSITIRATWDDYTEIQSIREEDRRYPKLYYQDEQLQLEGGWSSFTTEIRYFINSLLDTEDSLIGASKVDESGEQSMNYRDLKEALQ